MTIVKGNHRHAQVALGFYALVGRKRFNVLTLISRPAQHLPWQRPGHLSL